MPAVGTALAAAGTWLTSAATGKIVANLLISASLTALQSALQKYAMRRQPLPGIQTEYTAEGGTNPMSFIVGRYATGGQMVCPPMSHGKHRRNHNAYLTYVIALADVPGAPLEKVIINDQEVTFQSGSTTIPLGGAVPHGMPAAWYQMQGLDPQNPEAGITRIPIGRPATGEFAGNVWLTYYNGRQIAADPYLLQVYGEGTPWAEATERPWTPDMVGHGTCYAIVTFRLNPDLWQGPPRCLFELGGIPLYDPRRDSTAGGDGPQRWSDPATWAPSSNAKVIEYNILRGIPIGGGPLWGYGVPASALPLSDWAPAMNAADAAGEDGPVWRAGLEIGVDQEPATILDEILKVSHSQVAESSGVWKTAIGAGGAPVWHFTDRDVLLSAPSSQTPFPGLQNTYNAVHAAYPEPEQLWKSKDAPPRYNSAWEASDQARRLPAELSLPACPYAEQVQRVMRSYIEEERRFRRHVLAIVPEGAMLEPLDIVAWSSEENGYQNKRFRVTEMAEDLLTGEVTIAITERDPDDYSWRPDFRLPSVVPSIDMPAPAPIAPEFFSAEGIEITDDEGRARRAGVRLRWGGWAIEGVTGVRYEIEHGDQVLRGTMSDPVRGEHVARNLIPAQPGRARISFIGGADEWTEWANFLTPDVRLSLPDFAPDITGWLETMDEWIKGDLPGRINELARDIADDLAAAEEVRVRDAQDAAAKWRQTRDQIRNLTAQAVELAAAAHQAREEIRQSLAVEVGDIQARFDSVLTVMADTNFGAVIRLETLEVLSNQLSSRIQTLQQTMVDADEALALLITEMSVGDVTQFDHARIWHFNENTEGWTGTWQSGGYLRPVSGQAVSAEEVGVRAAGYSQFRARVERTGTPAWTGFLWWRDAGQAWATARRVEIPEPRWSGSEGFLTVAPGWTGSLDQIRIDLPAGIDIDWMAIGRPAPGASSAELSELRQTVTTANSAMSQDITQLRSEVNDAAGAVSGLADAVSGLETRVSATEGGLEVTGQALTALQGSVNDPITGNAALAEAFDQLKILASDGDGSQLVQSEAIRVLRSHLRLLTAEALEAAARDHMAAQRGRYLIAEASQSLSSRIDVTDDAVRIVVDAVTRLQAAIPGLATATALQALRTEVEAQGGALTVLSAAITDLVAAIDGKASSGALDALLARVEQTERGLSTQASSLTQLTSDLGDVRQAAQDAATLAGGKGRVFVQNNAPPASERLPQNLWIDTSNGLNRPRRWNGSSWEVVTDKVATDAAAAAARALQETAANAQATQALTTKVSQAENDISALSEFYTGLEAAVGRFSAQGLLRATVEANPSGALSRIGFYAAASSAEGAIREAALWLEALAGGLSRVVALANQFAIVSTRGGVRYVPFVVEGNRVYLDTAFIQEAHIDTLHLAGNAVTVPLSAVGNGGRGTGMGSWINVCSATLNLPASSTALILASFENYYETGSSEFDFRIRRGSTVIWERNSPQGIVARTEIGMMMVFDQAPAGTRTYHMDWKGLSNMVMQRGRVSIFGAKR